MQIDKAMSLAKKKIKSNLLNEAETIYRNILKKFPKNKRIKFALKQLQQNHNFSQNLSLDPPVEKLTELVELLTQSRLDEALLNAEKLLVFYPNSFSLKTILSSIYVQMESYDSAIEIFNQLLEVKPNNADAYYNLAGALKFKGDTVSAIKNFKSTIQYNPEYFLAYHDLGDLYKSIGEFEKAVDWYERGISVSPKYAPLHNNLGNVVAELDDTDRALKLFKQAIIINPEYEDAWANFGTLLSMLKSEGQFDNKHLISLQDGSVSSDTSVKLSVLNLSFSEPGEATKVALADTLNLFSETEHRVIKNPNSNRTSADIRPTLPSKVVALMHFGRSGTGLLHSLADGHPEISTMPSIYFSEYFNGSMWCNIVSGGWDEMADRFIANYDVLFDASSKQPIETSMEPIIGMGRKEGLTRVGDNGDQVLCVDKIRFKKEVNRLLNLYESMDQFTFFQILQRSYNVVTNQGDDKPTLFYHIHNPSLYSKVNFLSHVPNVVWLLMVREPIQSCESWIKGGFEKNDLSECYERILSMLYEINSTFYNNPSAIGIRLEDIKFNPDESILAFCKLMGVQPHKSLYKMTSQGEKWWGDRASRDYKTDGMDPFGKTSIFRKVGSIFSEQDQFILRTLFYPFRVRFGYQEENQKQFLLDLKDIRPMLDEVFDFERVIHKRLGEVSKNLEKSLARRKFRIKLIDRWLVLNQHQTYPNMIRPMTINLPRKN